MKLTVLVENNTIIDQYYYAEPGVCYLLEDDDTSLLFDVGYSELFLQNAESIGIDIDSIDSIVLSHGHNDHTGGLSYFFNQIKHDKITIYAHTNAFLPKFYQNESIGSPMSESEFKEKANLILSKTPVAISERLTFLGEIPSMCAFEKRIPIGQVMQGTDKKDDFLLDDSAVVYRNKEGLFIITGCSHSGICNIIEYAKKVCDEDRIIGVIGGFHLKKLDEHTQQTIDYLKRQKIKALYPSHCTSFQVRAAMLQQMPIHEVGVGMTIHLDE